MNRILHYTALTLICHGGAYAEETTVAGGQSPDSRYRLNIVKKLDYDTNKDACDYSFQITSPELRNPLLSIQGSGFNYNKSIEESKAIWNSSSQFVAFSERTSKHTFETYIIAVSDKKAYRLEIPDYVMNALGRIKATNIDFACVSKPKQWNGDTLILDLHFTANARQDYACEVSLHVSHEENSFPRVSIEAVTDPQ